MGGLGPGIGGIELIVVAIVALVVVGPKDLPGMMRKVGRLVGKARGMANEFRASFDEMARQSELDDLRKEVEALRTNQGIHRLGADADAAFREIKADLNSDPTPPRPAPAPALTSPEGWSEVDQMTALPTPAPEPVAAAKPAAKSPAKAKPKASHAKATTTKTAATRTAKKPAGAKAKTATAKPATKAAAKPRKTAPKADT